MILPSFLTLGSYSDYISHLQQFLTKILASVVHFVSKVSKKIGLAMCSLERSSCKRECT